ncbi:MAG: DUF1987 domain-containing protein [Bacteroidales bacterium]|nr:MAG: DUF1987 domain-containing protein [Bacteroidales bacterium]
MKELIISQTFSTPGVVFNPKSGELKIEGRSIPENPDDLYLKLLEWIHGYFKKPAELTRIIVKLEYVNSGSSKFLLEIFRTLKRYHDEGKESVVEWYFEEEDESIMELGGHFESTTGLPFNMHIIY